MAASRSIRFGLSVVMILAVAAGAEATAPPASAGTPTWSIEPSPNVPKRLQTDSLRSVSCVSRASCIAVGYYSKATGGKDHTLVEAWNGSAWSIVRSPNTRAGLENYLISVSCTSASSCVAVGGSGKGRLTMTLIEVWNGSEWSIVSSPDVLGAESSDLNSVSCTASSCVAAGISEPRKGPPQPLIESWNGSVWSIVPTPTLLNGGTGALLGVSCSKPTACVAVGTADTSGSSQTLVESWNGSTWSVVPSPNFPDGQVSILDGVSCSRPRACMAVGNAVLGAAAEPLIESWNGSAWTITTSPAVSGINLGGVACPTSSSCVAVGSFYQAAASDFQTLIESWNGSAWSVVPSPNPSPSEVAFLGGVSCILRPQCTVVGENSTQAGNQTLVETLSR